MSEITEQESVTLPAIVAAVSSKSISYPNDQHIHIVTDEELDAMKTLSSQLEGGIALTACGVFATSIPGSIPAIKALWASAPVDPTAATWLTVSAVSLAFAIICGFHGLKRKDKVEELINNIRGREQIPLTPSTAVEA